MFAIVGLHPCGCGGACFRLWVCNALLRLWVCIFAVVGVQCTLAIVGVLFCDCVYCFLQLCCASRLISIGFVAHVEQVAKEAINAGANVINDVSGGILDANMLATAAELQVRSL